MPKGFDLEELSKTITEYVANAIAQKGTLPPTQPPTSEVKEISEYEGRMRASGIDKFKVPAYVAAINLYANEVDMKNRKPKGALVTYLNTEIADKIFKCLGYEVPYDEDDESNII